MPDMREHALALAREGWLVFPVYGLLEGACACGKPERGQVAKHPRTWHGHNDATTDEAQITVWWSDGADAPPGFAWECDPDSNIGIAVPDGIVIVDIDTRNGGLDTAAELEGLEGGLPTTRTIATSNNGAHLYYRVPEGLAYPKTAGQGVDLKQLGGYVLAPPSIHKSGTRYAVDLEGPIADAPAWLLALSLGKRKERTQRKRDRSEHSDALSPATLKDGDALIAVLEPAYVEGSKHAIATSFGGYCKSSGRSAALVEYVIGQLPSEDVDMRVESALTFYDYDKPAGFSTLKEHLPAAVLAQVETIVKAQRKRTSLNWDTQRAAVAAQKIEELVAQLEPGENPFHALAEADDRAADVPPLDYLCEYFGIAEGKVSLFGGFAGSGKSPLGLLFGVCIASGKPFLGQAVTQRPVTFLMYEGERLSRIRRQRICRALSIAPDSIELDLIRPYQGFSETSLKIMRDAALWFRDANGGKAALFVHDTYTSAMRGVDQNSAEYADALWALGDIGDETGAINIVLAHFKKSKDEETDLQMLSGHNAIASAAQTVLGLLPNKKKPEEITIHPSRVPETSFAPTTVVWTDVKDPHCKGESILQRTAAAKWGLACAVIEAPTKEADPNLRIAQDIYAALAGKPMGLTTDELFAGIVGKATTKTAVLQQLVHGKHIAFEKRGAKNAYRLKK